MYSESSLYDFLECRHVLQTQKNQAKWVNVRYSWVNVLCKQSLQVLRLVINCHVVVFTLVTKWKQKRLIPTFCSRCCTSERHYRYLKLACAKQTKKTMPVVTLPIFFLSFFFLFPLSTFLFPIQWTQDWRERLDRSNRKPGAKEDQQNHYRGAMELKQQVFHHENPTSKPVFWEQK